MTKRTLILEATTIPLFTIEAEANAVANKISKEIGLYITSIKVEPEANLSWALTNKFDPNVKRTA